MPRIPYLPISTAVAALTLAGCASVADLKPGTPYNEALKLYGKPSVTCSEPNGTHRVVWTQQPSGEFAWAVVFDKNENAISVTQVLTKESFNVLNQGQWNTQSIRCQFGQPAMVRTFADRPNHMVWEYRFYGQSEEYDMLFVTFDRSTNQMVGYTTGPDPEYNLLLLGR
ncbi:hypothetical protein [Orrella daihaiensis]|uniref:Lipoprotein n=1 Tax=Orrella daihaiensis TaxID=2782176 RepID=A0ABY4ANM9_9BURK|nr:hypothetical protein [Orrella daihaiensis]UOD51005.1 hypothetical protein DHf2319_03610 [Orrella daihaiensis]